MQTSSCRGSQDLGSAKQGKNSFSQQKQTQISPQAGHCLPTSASSAPASTSPCPRSVPFTPHQLSTLQMTFRFPNFKLGKFCLWPYHTQAAAKC